MTCFDKNLSNLLRILVETSNKTGESCANAAEFSAFIGTRKLKVSDFFLKKYREVYAGFGRLSIYQT